MDQVDLTVLAVVEEDHNLQVDELVEGMVHQVRLDLHSKVDQVPQVAVVDTSVVEVVNL